MLGASINRVLASRNPDESRKRLRDHVSRQRLQPEPPLHIDMKTAAAYGNDLQKVAAVLEAAA